MKKTLKKPRNIESTTKNFYTIRDKIIKSVEENKFPDTVNFDEVIKSLN